MHVFLGVYGPVEPVTVAYLDFLLRIWRAEVLPTSVGRIRGNKIQQLYHSIWTCNAHVIFVRKPAEVHFIIDLAC